MDRSLKKQLFIEKYLQTWYNLEPMTGDASFRTYIRVKTPVTTYVLMDSPPEYYSTKPFEEMAEWLLANNFSAPKIFHRDSENGFLLLEDFGDTLLQHVLKHDREYHYKRAIDVLVTLHKTIAPSWLPYYSHEIFLKELEIFTDYYIKHNHSAILTLDKKQNYLTIWSNVLKQLPDLGSVIVLRDYHVQNLMHIEDDGGLKSLGILDFQDAIIGSPIYDIVSILEDAREDVSFEFAGKIFDYYLEQMPNIDRDKARLAYDILGAQRNIRILGVFARKKIRDNNDNYLSLIPRVLKYVERDLTNPILSEVSDWHKIHQIHSE